MAFLSQKVLFIRLWLDGQRSRSSLPGLTDQLPYSRVKRASPLPGQPSPACFFLQGLESWGGGGHLLTWVLRSLECRCPCPFLLHLKLQVATGEFANWLFALAPRRLGAKLAEAESTRSNGLFYNPALSWLSSYFL